MSVHDAMPGDIYVDDKGHLFEVVMVCADPTVSMVRVYRTTEDAHLQPARSTPLSGALTAPMWDRFQRIYRPARGRVSHLHRMPPDPIGDTQ